MINIRTIRIKIGKIHFDIKGQTKSKLFFQADVSSKKWRNEFDFSTKIPQGRLVFVRFLKAIEDTKKIFRN